MALRRDMPTRDPKRAESDSGQSRDYDAKTGGWTKKAANPDDH
ncbi:hypothetical protein [Streptomyces gossypii]|nr:hypothetical protein [Streptomyces gossypii]